MLVDYADGQLSPSQSSEVAEHLAECQRCCTVLKALQGSLELAEIIWQDGLADTESIRAGIPAKHRWVWQRYAVIAASILVMLSACLFLWRQQVKSSRVVERSFAEIERRINEAGSAARLLAATELLAGRPHAGDLVKSQYRYIVDRYPDTEAAVQARLKLKGSS
jgi:hypothetical protein